MQQIALRILQIPCGHLEIAFTGSPNLGSRSPPQFTIKHEHDDDKEQITIVKKEAQDDQKSRKSSFAKAMKSSTVNASSSQSSGAAAGGPVLKAHEVDLAATLVAISVVFIVCQSIKLIPDIYEMVTCDHFNFNSQATITNSTSDNNSDMG